MDTSPIDIVLANINFANNILDIIENEETSLETFVEYLKITEKNISRLEELGAVIEKINNRYYLKDLKLNRSL